MGIRGKGFPQVGEIERAAAKRAARRDESSDRKQLRYRGKAGNGDEAVKRTPYSASTVTPTSTRCAPPPRIMPRSNDTSL